jgi:hypothetical protein
MFIRFGQVVFPESEFRRLEFNDDGTATLFLSGEPDGIPLNEQLADEIDHFFRERHEAGIGLIGLDVYVAVSPQNSSSSLAPVSEIPAARFASSLAQETR